MENLKEEIAVKRVSKKRKRKLKKKIIGINLNQLKSTNYGICFKQIIDEIEESMYEIKEMDIEYKLIKFFP